MIKDAQCLDGLLEDWKAVRIAQAMVKTNLASACRGFGIVMPPFPDLCHSLLLPFAFSVLEHALHQLRDEEAFTCKRSTLGPMMHASKSCLPWVDFSVVDEAREKRNDLAHDRKVIPAQDCSRYLDAIETELVAWSVLPYRVKGSYSISVGGPKRET